MGPTSPVTNPPTAAECSTEAAAAAAGMGFIGAWIFAIFFSGSWQGAFCGAGARIASPAKGSEKRTLETQRVEPMPQSKP